MLPAVDLCKESTKHHFFFMGGATEAIAPVLHCPQNKNAVRTTYNVEILLKPGFCQNRPLKIPWCLSALCALSLAPCSSLKPPNDTTPGGTQPSHDVVSYVPGSWFGPCFARIGEIRCTAAMQLYRCTAAL